MKKSILSVGLFVIVFIVSYIGLCYFVPGLRIKLAADAMTYFVESISHMILFKGILSLVIGFVFASIPFLVSKHSQKKY
jgi:hypothetical protein